MNSDLGTARNIRMRPTGTIIAPPTPWMKRASTSVVSDVAAAHNSDPTTKTAMAARKTVRAPKRSATQPQMGMNTPRPTT